MTDVYSFILLKTQIGKKKEKGILRAGLSNVEVLAGTLLIEKRPYNRGEPKLVLEVDDQDGTVLESSEEDLHQLTKIQFQLLQTVPSCKERLLIYLDKEWLHEGESLCIGELVLVHIKGHPNLLGVIRYRGTLPAMRGIHFGVELLDGNGNGTCDGMFHRKRYFNCSEKNAVFKGINELRRTKIPRTSVEHADRTESFPRDQPRPLLNSRLKTGDRVVWMSDRGPESGIVKWIGTLPNSHSHEDITVGVEFDHPVGTGTGKYKDHRLFSAKQNHASLIPILGLMTEKEFNPDASPSNAEAENVEQILAMASSGKSEVIEEQKAMLEQIQQQKLSSEAEAEAKPLHVHLKKYSSKKAFNESVQTVPSRHPVKNNVFMPSAAQSINDIVNVGVVNTADSLVKHKGDQLRYPNTDNNRKLGMNPLYEHNRKKEGTENYVALAVLPKVLFEKYPDDRDLHILSTYVGKDYTDLAFSLGISITEIEQIQNSSNSVLEQIYWVLLQWRERTATPTYSELQQALSRSGINPNILCNILPTEKDYCNQQGNSAAIETGPKYDAFLPGHKAVEISTEQPSSGGSLSRLRNSLKFATPVDPDLVVGSMVEVMHNPPWYGLIRWIGHLADQKDPTKPIAGLEMEEEISAGTDGTFAQHRFFECAPRKAFFVPLYKCRKDKRFLDQGTKQLPYIGSENNFGSIETPDVRGTVSPPDSFDELSKICGKNRGIQGHHNSCYLDATLFGMFFNTTVFDSILYRPRRKNDLEQYEEVKKVLKEGIVNPLRKYYYVRADKVMKLRRLLHELGNVPGMMTEEKDPEEFLIPFLQKITKADPLLQISSKDGHTQQAYFYQLFMEKDEKLVLPTTQQLFELSFLENNIKLQEIPSCLILQMPRFGKDYKMYRRIIPCLELDITDVLENAPRECIICGDLAAYECSQCYQVHGAGLNTIAFCEPCKMTSHQHKNRINHSPRDIKVPDSFKEYYVNQKLKLLDSVTIQREKMELFAVVCIQTSHYVSFVKCGRGVKAPWVFFDSMADRMGEQSGYNIPEITLCDALPTWLSESYQKEIIKQSEDKNLPEHMRRLLCDAYMCMYQSPAVQMYK